MHLFIQAGPALNHEKHTRGFTLIELMIVIAVIAIILALAIPTYASYVVRAKISEALSVGAGAKTAVASTCQEDPTLIGLTNSAAGYNFDEPLEFVADIQVSGDCTDPIVTITTDNTGAVPAPEIILTGSVSVGTGNMGWTCTSTSPNRLLPSTCRS
jgi:type IV pilus assembly protein PilA